MHSRCLHVRTYVGIVHSCYVCEGGEGVEGEREGGGGRKREGEGGRDGEREGERERLKWTQTSLSITALLQSFLQVDCIKQNFKGKLVGMVLDGYLSLRR